MEIEASSNSYKNVKFLYFENTGNIACAIGNIGLMRIKPTKNIRKGYGQYIYFGEKYDSFHDYSCII